MKIDFSDVDCVVISHGHIDHTAVTVEVVQETGGVRVYGHPHTFLTRFSEDKDGKRKPGGPRKGEQLSDIESAGGEVIFARAKNNLRIGLSERKIMSSVYHACYIMFACANQCKH